jgi:type VI secretion system protein ImpF
VAELTFQERLQPSLLDRLTDDDPESRSEPRERRVLSMRNLRQSVLRDVGWLLNATGLCAGQDLSEYPLVGETVLNFGLPDLAGKTASGLDLAELERLIAQAIEHFEPRILRDSVRVRAVASGDAQGQLNTLIFEIHGDLWAQPLPERLFLKTELDLEGGEVRVSESAA